MTVSSRNQILATIAKSLSDKDISGEDRLAVVDRRISARQTNTVPARAQLGLEDRIDLFVTEAERVDATVSRLSAPNDLPKAVAAYLADNDLPPRIMAAPDPLLKTVPWSQQQSLSVTFGPTSGGDLVGLSVAFAGVAETGTLSLHSGPESPTTLNFLPDYHLVVLPTWRLFGTYEDAWAALRGTGNGAMPRTVNWITGPSRTADIEQTLLMGAHGPRSLHIFIYNDKENS